MKMTLTPYNAKYVYDNRGLYIPLSLLRADQIVKDAAKRAGIELKVLSPENFVKAESKQQIEKLFENINPPNEFPNSHSRIMTRAEYIELYKCAKKHDLNLWKSLHENSELVLDDRTRRELTINPILDENPENFDEYNEEDGRFLFEKYSGAMGIFRGVREVIDTKPIRLPYLDTPLPWIIKPNLKSC